MNICIYSRDPIFLSLFVRGKMYWYWEARDLESEVRALASTPLTFSSLESPAFRMNSRVSLLDKEKTAVAVMHYRRSRGGRGVSILFLSFCFCRCPGWDFLLKKKTFAAGGAGAPGET